MTFVSWQLRGGAKSNDREDEDLDEKKHVSSKIMEREPLSIFRFTPLNVINKEPYKHL